MDFQRYGRGSVSEHLYSRGVHGALAAHEREERELCCSTLRVVGSTNHAGASGLFNEEV